MCRLCNQVMDVLINPQNFVFLLLFLIYFNSGVYSQMNMNLLNSIQSARQNNCSNCKRILDLSIAEKRRLDIIMKRIINKLDIEPRTKTGQQVRVKPIESGQTQQKHNFPEMSELVSFPEKTDNTSKNVLLFTINVRNTPGPLEAIKVNLWIYVRQRKKRRSRGKKIWLRVSQVDDDNKKLHYLTSIRTRVKKTRWQKIGLPVTFIQSMLDDNQQSLKLKISCKKCGKIIRPVLQRRSLHRKRRHNRKKNKNRKLASIKHRSFKNADSVQPFLVISTRYKYNIR